MRSRQTGVSIHNGEGRTSFPDLDEVYRPSLQGRTLEPVQSVAERNRVVGSCHYAVPEVEVAVSLIQLEIVGKHGRSVSVLIAETCNVVDGVRPGVIYVESETTLQSSLERCLERVIGGGS